MVKHYVVIKEDDNLGLELGDRYVSDEPTNSYYCIKTDSEISEEGEYVTSTFRMLPSSIVENNSFFELDLSVDATVKPKQELEEVPVEQVIKETKEEIDSYYLVNKELKVILAFPGAREGDIYKYNDKRNTFVKQTPVDEEEYLLGIWNGKIDELPVDTVLENIDYFEDITPKVVKSKEDIIMKIADLAEQRLGIEQLIKGSDNKLFVNKSKKQVQIISKVIEALEWSIGEGPDFIIE